MFNLSPTTILVRALVLFTTMPIHECAHGWVADKLGDHTARQAGRLTLNPFHHLDLFGSILLLFAGVGWAKPVPVNPYYFTKVDRRAGIALTALAGPMSNILMALLTMILYKAVLLLPLPTFLASFLEMVFMVMCVTNLNLAVFNLIPVHPLDGSRILAFFLPDKALRWIDEHEQIIYIVFMASCGSLPRCSWEYKEEGPLTEQLSFKVAQVEGPLDLILQLISKHKLNIYDIEIAKLLEQYLDYVEQMQSQQLEVASEFLEMASRLVYIKSVSLLPKHEELEEQLKKELTGQLIEYTLCRQVAQLLKNRFVGDELFVRPMQKDAAVPDAAYPLHHNSRLLLDAYLSAVGRRKLPQQENRSFEPMMARRVVSVNSRIVVVMKLLYRKKRTSFLSLFESSSDRSEVVATFLAVLELMKNKRVLLESDGKTIRLL